jgi:Holliday junction resolvase RusA-like endonuclease
MPLKHVKQIVTLKRHPELDFMIGYLNGPVIPTKQDKYIPVQDYEVVFDLDENRPDIFNDYQLYIKKKSDNSLKLFEAQFIELIKKELTQEHPYPKEISVEVIICITMSEARLKKVDVDNLTKSILDCFNGLVFIDDSQVINVLSMKKVHPLYQTNGITVGIRKIKNNEDSWFKNIKLINFETTTE